MAFGGAGVGKLKMEDGQDFVVFVDKVVPGDIISARITNSRKNYAEAVFEKIIKPSEIRVTARCKHFGYCGGCALQFMTYENQLKWKEKMVRDAFEKIGGFRELKIEPIIGCKTPWFYRNKMEYSFGDDWSGGRETTKLTLGLHPAKKYRDVFDVEECFLQSETSVRILYAVREWARNKSIPQFNYNSNSGVLKNLVIREGKNTGEILVNIITNGDADTHKDSFKKLISEKFPEVTSLYQTSVFVKRGHKTAIKEDLLAGKKTLSENLTMKMGGSLAQLKFEILPQAFFQPNTLQAQVLYEIAFELAEANPQDIVLDLFCGTGTIGMFFAKHGANTIGIDLNESAIINAKANAEYNNLKNIEFLCGDVGAVLKQINHKPTILITDPPRAGIDPSALRKILELDVNKWVYVSCNPTTLARDLATIVADGRYMIRAVQPVDMFPQTYHTETIVALHRQTA